MKNLKKTIFVATLAMCCLTSVMAQNNNVVKRKMVKVDSGTESTQKNVNNITSEKPKRISMNIIVSRQTQGNSFGEKAKQTQGATFGEKVNVSLVENGCIVLFPSNEGYSVNVVDKSITELTKNECVAFSKKINQGLHTAKGASLLGGALPGGAIISAAVSSVGHLASGGSGAAAASYAKTGKLDLKIADTENNAILELPNGEYELTFVIEEKATSGLKGNLKTQVSIGFSVENGILKTKHDTAKNTVSNIR